MVSPVTLGQMWDDTVADIDDAEAAYAAFVLDHGVIGAACDTAFGRPLSELPADELPYWDTAATRASDEKRREKAKAQETRQQERAAQEARLRADEYEALCRQRAEHGRATFIGHPRTWRQLRAPTLGL